MASKCSMETARRARRMQIGFAVRIGRAAHVISLRTVRPWDRRRGGGPRHAASWTGLRKPAAPGNCIVGNCNVGNYTVGNCNGRPAVRGIVAAQPRSRPPCREGTFPGTLPARGPAAPGRSGLRPAAACCERPPSPPVAA